MSNSNQLVSELNNLSEKKDKLKHYYKNFIHKIRFPVFKNLESNSEIKFEYPFTVLVGQNGCGKSSALHALQGAPSGRSVGNYWFSTNLDPIKESKGKPNCFIYEYFNTEANDYVEIIKIRVKYNKSKDEGKKKLNPDYWEPKRASVEYGMKVPKKNGGTPEPGSLNTRWKVPKIKVEYLDFRSELSAFDQYFYFGEKPENLTRYNSKQDRLRSWIKNQLSPIITGKTKHSLNRAQKKLNPNPAIQLSSDEVQVISNILGKNYKSCYMVEHKIFGSMGYSIRFISDDRSYTEAFAGSGEMAVVRVVHTVMNAEEGSLILLDEPEVSLHPGAQKKLRDFLLKNCIERKHQIVACSHSPVFIENLPDKAIKVFLPNKEGQFRIINNVNVNDAFVQLGHTISNKKRIIVEDDAAKALVDYALKTLGTEYTETIEVQFYPGGETSIFKDLVVHARHEDNNIYVIFDGDIKKGDWPKEDTIPKSQLDETIKNFCGQKVENLSFRNDGGNDTNSEKRLEDTKRKYIKYLGARCFFLPTDTPEELIWKAATLPEKAKIENELENSEKNIYKKYLCAYVKEKTDEDSSVYRKVFISNILKEHFDNENLMFKELLDTLKIIKDYQ